MAETCRQILKDVGVLSGRMALEWASAAEGPRLVELITGFVSLIKSMGPLGRGDGEAGEGFLARRLRAAVMAAEATKVRTAFGSLAKKIHASGDYGAETIAAGVSEKVLPAFRQERLNQEVLLCLMERGLSDIGTLCEMTGGAGEDMEKTVASLSKKGVIREEGTGWALA
jgi:hypothetical protein